jgi:hypothetical protein
MITIANATSRYQQARQNDGTHEADTALDKFE